jgi:hypothetical protein
MIWFDVIGGITPQAGSPMMVQSPMAAVVAASDSAH